MILFKPNLHPSIKTIKAIGLSCALLSLGACVTPDRQYTATGAAIGTVAGAILGHQIDDRRGRYAGGAAGALIGAAIGNNADAIRNRHYREPAPAYDSAPRDDYDQRYGSRDPYRDDAYGYGRRHYRY